MIIASASGPSLWEYSEQLVRKEALTAKFAIRQCNKKRLYWPKLHEPCHRAYFERALPIVKEQMKKVGVRLARLIEAAADGTLPRILYS